ncbi:DNA repair protein RadD [Comamonas odontotermitis]|uniref:DNA repair protein RadD n=1 Tax=Comamonas odontotermitis TaxID=379895 RepID=A0ABR6RIL3_9BURK|nr:DEAD/DEAH box helicase [Comamonas odontotermitis]MBB6578996.1 DNA repair protein RadD [Comamonas odontotermitis]
MIELYPYQREAVQSVFEYFHTSKGNPLIELPTGSGKSLTMASTVKQAIDIYPPTNILLLTHVKELIEQDYKAILKYWPEAPIGIWSAGVGIKRQAQITVAGIQSIHKHPARFGNTHLVLVDECHLIPAKTDTTYQRFIGALRAYNPNLKVIGFTATPYRTDSGLLTEGDNAIFTDIAYSANVGDLIQQGYLCPLVAKNGVTKADLSGVGTSKGDFNNTALQHAMNKDALIEGAFDEVAIYAADRKHILGFCTGVEHAQRCAELANARGWAADYVDGTMGKTEREGKIASFKSGAIRFLFNANILTTGFDAPMIDCLVMLRPTKSTGLYVQIMGRGLRKHPSKDNTLVLDFAGNIERHGPIDQIKVKSKRKSGEKAVSVAPVKECPSCHELVHTSVRVCPGCDHQFPESDNPSHGTEATAADPVAALAKPRRVAVDSITYSPHTKNDRNSLKVEYTCGDHVYTEWVPIEDPRSYVRKHAVQWFWSHGRHACPDTVADALNLLEQGDLVPTPQYIEVVRDGTYWRVKERFGISHRPGIATVEREVSLGNLMRAWG